ncbi:hypothetical protein ND748_21035 [Frankia sp. AiPs1]|uniref:hypothetical protein n=1 Tax=Frankia sp. AiPs1 TaxID=573493 RepID=UPI0020447B2D|nr:hypothetical protein [Frankia sp. AiPs1]MCM3924140.1 hypothetical protein [Frankia sp. AiPs1]
MVTVPDDSLAPNIFTARHVGDEYNGIMREFRGAVAIAGAQHIEYYDHGLPTVAVDLLAHPVLAENFRGARTVERARRDYETIGRQLNHRMTEMNAALFGVAGGRLIRTVFAAPDRAVLYFDVDEGQYIVGVSLTAQTLAAADLALSEAAARIRTARGLADPNYGGYHQGGYYQSPLEPLATGAVDARPGDDVEGAAGGAPGGAAHVFASLPRPSVPVFANPWAALIHRRWSPLRDAREELFQAQAANILQPADLQYIALVREGRVSAADVLDHSDLNEFFVGPGRTARRDAFELVGAEFLVLSDLLDGLLRSVLNRRLTRTVLDVEKGALYFHRISRDEVLLGVTVDQRRVADADRRFQLLVHRFTAARGE